MVWTYATGDDTVYMLFSLLSVSLKTKLEACKIPLSVCLSLFRFEPISTFLLNRAVTQLKQALYRTF
jgi:hypothetical protein